MRDFDDGARLRDALGRSVRLCYERRPTHCEALWGIFMCAW